MASLFCNLGMHKTHSSIQVFYQNLIFQTYENYELVIYLLTLLFIRKYVMLWIMKEYQTWEWITSYYLEFH